MTEEQAIANVTDAFYPRLKDAGLLPYMRKIRQAGDDVAVMAINAEMEALPVWREFQQALQAQMISPAMQEAMAAHLALHRAGQGETDEGHLAFMRVMDLAPDWLLDEFLSKGKEMGVIPGRPSGYTEDGTPMYSLDAIGEMMWLSEEEAAAEVERFMALREQAGLSNDGIVNGDAGIHRVQ